MEGVCSLWRHYQIPGQFPLSDNGSEEERMARKEYCRRCGKNVAVREKRTELEGTGGPKIEVSCPECGRAFRTTYGAQRDLRPVRNAKISKG